jgi:hypothetical protein
MNRKLCDHAQTHAPNGHIDDLLVSHPFLAIVFPHDPHQSVDGMPRVAPRFSLSGEITAECHML